MSKSRIAAISSRKQPRQARSTELVTAVLEAATQVLAKEGATRFTTARVAEKAGCSVGSLYQYFPNKAAILFRLQSDEWRQTSELVRDILGDTAVPPLDRLRALAQAFLRSECREAAVRIALGDAAPFYRDAPESRAARATGSESMAIFICEALPDTAPVGRARATELIATTLSCVAKRFSESPRTPDEIDGYAGALGDMLCAYLERLRGEAAMPGFPGSRPAR